LTRSALHLFSEAQDISFHGSSYTHGRNACPAIAIDEQGVALSPEPAGTTGVHWHSHSIPDRSLLFDASLQAEPAADAGLHLV
jgi:hypothetical protein